MQLFADPLAEVSLPAPISQISSYSKLSNEDFFHTKKKKKSGRFGNIKSRSSELGACYFGFRNNPKACLMKNLL